MSKKAATEDKLGLLHSKIADVFIKVTQRYIDRLDVLDEVDPKSIEDEALAELLAEASMPNPAMLAAVCKFLKDNSISFDTEKLEELSDQERRLQERKERRGNIVDLSTLKVQSG